MQTEENCTRQTGTTDLKSQPGKFEESLCQIPVQTVVWVANRCNPIDGSSGFLTVNPDGNLVLLSQNKSVVWSTNSSKQVKKPIAQLLDSGNLVLREEEDLNSDAYLWQSIDYPTDTFLPGMKFGWDLRQGLNTQLPAWRNGDDPCSGDLSCGFGADIYPEGVIWKGKATFYRSGPWNGIGFSGSPEMNAEQLFDSHVVYNGNELYYMSKLKNNSVISIVVLNQTNMPAERLIWMEEDQSWRSYFTTPRDDCDNYGHCGANANCMVLETLGICQCSKRYKPKSPQRWDLRDWSEGCVRNK
ncbi:hypothetical protein TIFTF001_035916 [Ficus carica]|uniref:Bulb-type lectin domain-containing protein n=1 Tax=Ficus carica TaxID=3494 RepID=A0AA88E2G1_FICCA|nr:hypothetical protein TIFTF001_035916 [Ficus carica]